ncbi:MAG: hypothetical protein Tsb005_04360 [Gammaproteobacteria bacterium]
MGQILGRDTNQSTESRTENLLIEENKNTLNNNSDSELGENYSKNEHELIKLEDEENEEIDISENQEQITDVLSMPKPASIAKKTFLGSYYFILSITTLIYYILPVIRYLLREQGIYLRITAPISVIVLNLFNNLFYGKIALQYLRDIFTDKKTSAGQKVLMSFLTLLNSILPLIPPFALSLSELLVALQEANDRDDSFSELQLILLNLQKVGVAASLVSNASLTTYAAAKSIEDIWGPFFFKLKNRTLISDSTVNWPYTIKLKHMLLQALKDLDQRKGVTLPHVRSSIFELVTEAEFTEKAYGTYLLLSKANRPIPPILKKFIFPLIANVRGITFTLAFNGLTFATNYFFDFIITRDPQRSNRLNPYAWLLTFSIMSSQLYTGFKVGRDNAYTMLEAPFRSDWKDALPFAWREKPKLMTSLLLITFYLAWHSWVFSTQVISDTAPDVLKFFAPLAIVFVPLFNFEFGALFLFAVFHTYLEKYGTPEQRKILIQSKVLQTAIKEVELMPNNKLAHALHNEAEGQRFIEWLKEKDPENEQEFEMHCRRSQEELKNNGDFTISKTLGNFGFLRCIKPRENDEGLELKILRPGEI